MANIYFFKTQELRSKNTKAILNTRKLSNVGLNNLLFEIKQSLTW